LAESRKKAFDLEKTIAELEKIVEQLEEGQLPLDKSLRQFEKGVQLSRQCQSALRDAEQKVQVLMGDQLGELDPGALEEAVAGADGRGDRRGRLARGMGAPQASQNRMYPIRRNRALTYAGPGMPRKSGSFFHIGPGPATAVRP